MPRHEGGKKSGRASLPISTMKSMPLLRLPKPLIELQHVDRHDISLVNSWRRITLLNMFSGIKSLLKALLEHKIIIMDRVYRLKELNDSFDNDCCVESYEKLR